MKPESEGGLSIKDRKYHLRIYKNCFSKILLKIT